MSKYDIPLRERIVTDEPFTREEVVDELDTLRNQLNDYEEVMNDVHQAFGTMELGEASIIDDNGNEIPEEDRILDESTRGRFQVQLSDDRQVIRAKHDKKRLKDKQKYQNRDKGE
jgi:hypothetical protein